MAEMKTIVKPLRLRRIRINMQVLVESLRSVTRSPQESRLITDLPGDLQMVSFRDMGHNVIEFIVYSEDFRSVASGSVPPEMKLIFERVDIDQTQV